MGVPKTALPTTRYAKMRHAKANQHFLSIVPKISETSITIGGSGISYCACADPENFLRGGGGGGTKFPEGV